MRRPTLPPAWYQTLAETAAELDTHAERVLYYADAGLILPAALVAKALLPVPYPGPSPHLIVRLDDYRTMAWVPDGTDMIAPLVGVYRAYQVDGHGFTNLDLDGAGVLIRRSQLVFTSDQVEALQDACGITKPPHPAKVRTLQQILGYLVAERWPDCGHYTIAENVLRGLQLNGVSLSKETIASHIREARSAAEAASKRETAKPTYIAG
jgi:hypothetical protein